MLRLPPWPSPPLECILAQTCPDGTSVSDPGADASTTGSCSSLPQPLSSPHPAAATTLTTAASPAPT
eukprot:2068864-Pleurochrysis_carterae.AAC.1